MSAEMSANAAEVKTATCYMCACRCGIRVHLKDGEIRSIDGNPAHPLNKGVICAKGASGIMKQKSPARLTRLLKRKRGSERGAGEFDPVSWDEVFSILEERLRNIRATDPKKFALFTGRDQMQALTTLFARRFGDVHDPESVVSKAIREAGGYALMPEWGTIPANHYPPRRKTEFKE